MTVGEFRKSAEELSSKVKPCIIRMFMRQGCPRYAAIARKLKFALLPPYSDAIAYIRPSNGTIYINAGLDPDDEEGDMSALSVVVRHEILHHMLKHEARMINYLSDKFKDTFGDSFDADEVASVVKNYMYSTKLFNICADLEISNRGYTAKDKEIIRRMKLNSKVVSGLVTEYYPGYVKGMENMSLTELYEKLSETEDKVNDMSNLDDDKNADGMGSAGGENSVGSEMSATSKVEVHGTFINNGCFVASNGKRFYGRMAGDSK